MTVYTLFRQQATGTTLDNTDANPYTVGVQFSVSQPATLTAIWWYSASGATVDPQTIALYQVSGTSLVHSESASWSGAAGSGWVRAAFTAPPSLAISAAYKACILQTSSVDWYSVTASYWSSGAGASGITNGPLSAPNEAGASPGQNSYNGPSATLAYPGTDISGDNFWIDAEITAAPFAPILLPNFPAVITSNAGWRGAGHSR